MARDVEFNVTASDKTGMALAAAERNFKRTSDNITKESKKTGDGIGKGISGGILDAVGKIAPKAVPQLAEMLGAAGKLGGPALAAGIALAAPALGAVVSGAIIGGVGIGGVLGGVALASRDPRVAAAGKVLGSNLLGGLEDDARVFVAPVLGVIGKIETRFEQMRPKIRNIFADSAGFLDPLVEGALDGVDGILAGVERLISQAGPVIDAFADGFATLGQDIGEALAIISGGSDDAADSIRAVFTVIGESIVIAARFLRVLTETFGFLVKLQNSIGNVIPFLDFFGDSLDKSADGQRRLGSGTFDTNEAIDAQVNSAVDLTSSLEDAERAVQGVYQAQNDLYSSTTNVATAMAKATGTIKENGRTLSLNSEKGRENREALSSVAGALQRNYDGYVKVNGVGAGSAKVAEDLRNKFIGLAQKAGLSAQKAQELANKLLNIPSKRDTKVNVATQEALDDINGVKQKMGEVKSKTVSITVKVNAKISESVGNINKGIGNLFSASDYWSSVDVQSGTSRTGGPAPVAVTNDVAVSLDGAPFYAMTARAVQRSADRQAWRTKVGRR